MLKFVKIQDTLSRCKIWLARTKLDNFQYTR